MVLHMNPRMDEGGALVRNSFLGGCWGQEERDVASSHPFQRGRYFDVSGEGARRDFGGLGGVLGVLGDFREGIWGPGWGTGWDLECGRGLWKVWGLCVALGGVWGGIWGPHGGSERVLGSWLTLGEHRGILGGSGRGTG